MGERFLIGSPAYSISPQGKLEIAQLDKGKVDAEIQSSYQNAVSNFRSNRTYAKTLYIAHDNFDNLHYSFMGYGAPPRSANA